ncbi:MAG: S-layer homology domain-containing protein [Oscillospiraceae bacterium]|nr:S-layer homology domain-containing protein [Oscillospiraceae bacterium]
MKRAVLALVCAAALAVPACALGVLQPEQSSYEFLAPADVLLQADGSLLVADSGNNAIVQLRDGTAQVVAGYTLPLGEDGYPKGGYLDGSAAYALFNRPTSLVEWNGGIVVSDRENHCLRVIEDGAVRTLAGSGTAGLKDGAAAKAMFHAPRGLAVNNGVLYIADSGNGCIRALNAKGQVSTYVSGLNEPTDLCWVNGVLYITDAGTHQIISVKNGQKKVFAGSSVRDGEAYIGGFLDGECRSAEFAYPQGICAVGSTLYVSDTGNSAIRKISDGWVSTVAACSAANNELWPGNPAGLSAKGQSIYVADEFGGKVLAVDGGKQLYQDVPADSEHSKAISYMYVYGLMHGTGGTTFMPEGKTVRAAVVAVLHRLSGYPEAEGAAPFHDVSKGAWYYDAMAWAAENKIVQGYPDGRFGPNVEVTREQMAVFLYRYARNGGLAAYEGRSTLDSYSDGGEVGGYAVEAMNWALENGVIEVQAGKLAPQKEVNRAELAEIMTRFVLYWDNLEVN